MKTLRRTEGAQTFFIIADLPASYHQAAQSLFYSPTDEGFIKAFPTNAPHLDRVYQNFERSIEELILQTANIKPVPWEEALEAVLKMLEGQGLDWWLAGSAALAARGLDVKPHDLDLIVDSAGAQKLADLFLDDLVEPLSRTEGWISEWFGRAFLAARVEWVGNVRPEADQPNVTDFGLIAASRLETITWRNHSLRVPPLELQLLVSERRGLSDRVAKIKQALERRS